MRLLQISSNGKLSLVEHIGSDVPPYAILSHTWGPSEDEVTFQDILDGTGKLKPGYCKVDFCSKQAQEDGFYHFWIDTCCIDKTSSSELSEAINSMFTWYRKAAVCYVYLTDVNCNTADYNFRHIERVVSDSKWFTRGWTLQELLAPSSLQFFSKQAVKLGSREDLCTMISRVTRIRPHYLFGWEETKAATISERMSWMYKRSTTRPEDSAYCLLGIFNIHMALLYGEGWGAFRRLQEEIIRVSNDQTIFCWAHKIDTVPQTWGSILAPHPAAFEDCGHYYEQSPLSTASAITYRFTNAGLSIKLPVVHVHKGIYALLDVKGDTIDPDSILGIPLKRTDQGTYRRVRIPHHPAIIALSANESSKRHKIYVSAKEEENFQLYGQTKASANIIQRQPTNTATVHRLYLTFDTRVSLSIPKVLMRSPSSAGILRFSKKWSMVEARPHGPNSRGSVLIEVCLADNQFIEPTTRYFCLLTVRSLPAKQAHWSIFAFLLCESPSMVEAVKIASQCSLPNVGSIASTSSDYFQGNPNMLPRRLRPAGYSDYHLGPPHHVVHFTLYPEDYEAGRVSVDVLLNSLVEVYDYSKRELKVIRDAVYDIDNQRKQRRWG